MTTKCSIAVPRPSLCGAALLLLLTGAGRCRGQAVPEKPARPALPVETVKPLGDDALLTEVQKRACRFFWEKSDPITGLCNDRAANRGTEDDYTIASTASTGYALASLPIAVQHGWRDKKDAYDRALLTLTFLRDRLPNVHGWNYHFLDKRTGERAWNCELSSIDTALLLEGVLIAGQYWKGTEVETIANTLYNRVDWTWMRTNGGTQPDKKLLSMGWKPDTGFLSGNWDHYCELMVIYLLGLGAENDPLPADSWTAWTRNPVTYKGKTTLAAGPIFFYQMAQGFYDFRNRRDALGWNYALVARNGIEINRQFALDHTDKRKTYAPDIWGLNASDAPDGYRAYGGPGEGDEDGTVSPTGAMASILFRPDLAKRAAQAMYTRYGDRLWGRYGLSNAFNVDHNWYDPDVIGIDLGMALLAIEDARTGLPQKLLASHPSTSRALRRAGFRDVKDGDTLQAEVKGR